MSSLADTIISALGGSTVISKATGAPVSTVHSWRRIGIPPARLNHLKLVVDSVGIRIDWDTGQRLDDGKLRADGSRKAEEVTEPRADAA